MCKIFAFLVAFWCTLPLSFAQTGNKAEAQKHYDLARTHYDLGNFDEAITEFEEAYRLYQSPGILFNLGQCHRQKGNDQKALFLYKRYLSEAPQNAPNRADAEKYVKEIEERLKAIVTANPSIAPDIVPASTPVKPPESLPASTSVPAASIPALQLQPPAPKATVAEPNLKRALLWVGVSVLGVAAVTGTGIGAAAAIKSDRRDSTFGEIPFF